MPSASFTPRVVRANRRHEDDVDRRLAHHGWFNSFKLGANLAYRGLLAFDFLTLAEAHPQVLQISGRPAPILWWDNVSWEEYRPRYAVDLRTGQPGVYRTVDIEVIEQSKLDAQRIWAARVRRYARREGRTLLFLTERRIRIQPRLTNAKSILSQAGTGIVSEEERVILRRATEGAKSFSLNEVVATGVLTYPRAYSTVLNMVAAGELSFGLGRRFDGDTLVSPGRGR